MSSILAMWLDQSLTDSQVAHAILCFLQCRSRGANPVITHKPPPPQAIRRRISADRNARSIGPDKDTLHFPARSESTARNPRRLDPPRHSYHTQLNRPGSAKKLMSEVSFGYLQLAGVQGGSTDPRYPGFTRINTFNLMNDSPIHLGGRNGDGPPNRIVVTTPVDSHTPMLCQLRFSNRVFQSAPLVWLRGGLVIWRATFEDVSVAETSFRANDPSDMSLTLNFRHIDRGRLVPQAAATKLRMLAFQSRG